LRRSVGVTQKERSWSIFRDTFTTFPRFVTIERS